jgi:hypothetical protein
VEVKLQPFSSLAIDGVSAVSLSPLVPYAMEKCRRYPPSRRQTGPQSWFNVVEEIKIS